MKNAEITNDGFLIQSGLFDAEATLFSGQCFRVKRTDGGIEVLSGDKKCVVKKCIDGKSSSDKGVVDNVLTDKAGNKGTSHKSDTQSSGHPNRTLIITDSPDYFYNYFDLDTDYGEIADSLSRFPELKDDIRTGRGIHILRQQLFETIISFIISANNNIPRIKGIIERLCLAYGEKKHSRGTEFYAFPTPHGLRDVKAEDYSALGAGYRAEYLKSTVGTILNSDILSRLPQMEYKDALKALLGLKGVGRKVADCICLFSLKITDCYPVDTWIKKRDALDPDEARLAAAQKYGRLAGYAQQYKYYSAIKNKEF